MYTLDVNRLCAPVRCTLDACTVHPLYVHRAQSMFTLSAHPLSAPSVCTICVHPCCAVLLRDPLCPPTMFTLDLHHPCAPSVCTLDAHPRCAPSVGILNVHPLCAPSMCATCTFHGCTMHQPCMQHAHAMCAPCNTMFAQCTPPLMCAPCTRHMRDPPCMQCSPHIPIWGENRDRSIRSHQNPN